MNCPHCGTETPATMPYCQSCGGAVDLTFEKVQSTFNAEAESKALRETELLCRGLLFTAAAALVIVLAARLSLVREAPRPHVLPPYVIEEAAASAAKDPVPLLPIEVPPIPVPATK